MKITAQNYIPFKGFYNLLAFDIPKSDFSKMYNIQKYLSDCENDGRAGKYKDNPNELNKVKNLSAEYQQLLFSYPVINDDLI